MKVLSNRTRRVGENIRAVLANVLLEKKNSIQGLDHPLITITEVQPSADLRNAKVFISCMGEDEVNIVKILNENAKLFSKLVAKELNTKYSPKLFFYIDHSFSQADKINNLINLK
ncbi:MAG: 30S ribosome-binding factor RbfA [Pseudomonadota bacterium]|nr:30S ribosome-binding factor RbfA [Pseudomonadota bacterium]|tara:strand:+ start:78 stop:422 length:345 start_codon:yes stop_codon:yes gene_type:complete